MLSSTDHNEHLTQGIHKACNLRATHFYPTLRHAHGTWQVSEGQRKGYARCLDGHLRAHGLHGPLVDCEDLAQNLFNFGNDDQARRTYDRMRIAPGQSGRSPHQNHEGGLEDLIVSLDDYTGTHDLRHGGDEP